MFEFFASGKYDHDMELTRKLNPKIRTFEQWLTDNRTAFETEFPWEILIPLGKLDITIVYINDGLEPISAGQFVLGFVTFIYRPELSRMWLARPSRWVQIRRERCFFWSWRAIDMYIFVVFFGEIARPGGGAKWLRQAERRKPDTAHLAVFYRVCVILLEWFRSAV